MQGKFRVKSSLYKCVAISSNIPPKTFLNTLEGNWKIRYYNNTKSFRKMKYSNDTILSGFL